MKNLLMLALLAWFGAAAGADDRWYTTDDGEKALVELDVSNVRRVEKGVAAWTRHTYRAEQSPLLDGEGKYRVERTLQYIDCGQWQSALKMSVRYSTDGAVVGSFTNLDNELRWSPLVPDSAGDHLAKLACGIVKGNEQRASKRAPAKAASR